MEGFRLSGTFDHTLDPKGRVTLPARYREYFQNGAILVRLPDGEPCVSVFHPDEWDKYDEKNFEPLDTFNNRDAAWRSRTVYMNNDFVEPDAQGRVVLGSKHIEKTGLAGKVTIIGARTHLEIWDPDTLNEKLEEMERSRA